jgi:hypothetical protein
MFVQLDALQRLGLVRFVLSHPFATKKAKGWGTVGLGD